MKRIALLIIFGFVVFVNALQAQRTIKPVSVSFTELSNGPQIPISSNPIIDGRDKDHDPDKKLPANLPIPPGAKNEKASVNTNSGVANRNMIASPIWSQDFNGLSDVRDRQTTSLIPPDTHGAVGIDRILTVTNGEVRILRKTNGGQIGNIVTLNTFWAPVATQLGYSLSTFDPKVIYDPFAQRFIFTACANGSSVNSALLLGVSQTSDPGGGWNLYGLDADASNTLWFDYPSIGFNKNWIVISGNMFPVVSGTQRADIYVFGKQSLYSGEAITFGNNYQQLILANNLGFTHAPAVDYDHTANDMYLVQSWNSGSGSIKLSRLSGTLPLVDRFDIGFVTSSPWANQGNSTFNFAPQLGSTRLINTNDGRMQNAVLVNGKIWAAHTIHLPSTSPTRSSIQWWCLNTSGGLLQNGVIDDALSLTPNFRGFPNICANKNDEVVIGYTVFNSNSYASAAYSYRNATDANGTMRDEQVYKTGADVYVKTFSTDVNARNRWGDYSNTMLDPIDQSFWTVQQFADTRNTSGDNNNFGRWNTWWAKIPAQTAGLNPLPVSLTNFSASLKNNQVVAAWETASEINVKEFVVERSNNGGITYTTIGKINATGGPSVKSNYSFTDVKPFFGRSFYRLKMIDKDASFTYSRTVEIVRREDQLQLTNVYPNPAGNQAYLSIYSPVKQQVDFSLIDMSGKTIQTKSMNVEIGYITIEYPLNNIKAGSYKIILNSKSGRAVSNLIKQ